MRFRFINMKMKIENTKGEKLGMSNLSKIKLDRKRLYDEIWELSVAGVAKKYDLHYLKLINSLKENNIPYPSSGYWTRRACGKDVSKEVVPLPVSEIQEVYLYPADYSSIKKKSETIQGKEKVECNNIKRDKYDDASKEDMNDKEKVSLTVPNTMLSFLDDKEKRTVIMALSDIRVNTNSKLHPILAAYKKSIEEWKQKERENSNVRKRYYDNRSGKIIEQPVLMSEVSDTGLNRVIAILDVLYKTIEKLGGKVIQNLSMKIRDDVVRITFAEGQDKKVHELTKKEAKELLEYKEKVRYNEYASKPQIRKYDYFYNGKIRIKFENGNYIRDNDQQKLEDRLDDILVQLYDISEENRKVRVKREEEHRIYLEEKRKEEQRLERIEKEKQKTQALINESKDYQVACEIRNYIKAVSDVGEITEEVNQWIKWAGEKADWFDPTIARTDLYLGKRQHSLSEDEKLLTKEKASRYYY